MRHKFVAPFLVSAFVVSSAVAGVAQEEQSLRDEWIGEHLDLLRAFKCVATEAGRYADKKFAEYDPDFAASVEPLGDYATTSLYVFGVDGYIESFADLYDPMVMSDYTQGVTPVVVDRYLKRFEVSVVKALKEQTPKYLDRLNAAIEGIEGGFDSLPFRDIVAVSDAQVDEFQGNFNYYAVNASRYTGIDYRQTFEDCRPESFKP